MQIGIDISSIVFGTGVSRYTANLTRALLTQYPKENFILYGGSLRRQDALKTFIKGLPHSPKAKLSRLSPALATLLFNGLHLPIEWFAGSLDVFHGWDWYTPSTKKAALVTTVHDLSALKFPHDTHPAIVAHHRQTLKWIKSEARAVIAVSESTKRDLVGLVGIPAKRITVIPEALPGEQKINPSSAAIAAIKDAYGVEKPYFLIVGSQERRKNIPRMIKAFAPYGKTHQLLIVGKGGYDSFTKPDYVSVTGYLSSQALACLYRGSEGLLYASLYEGFGLPILEAFYHGVPVITSRTSSLMEVAGDAAAYCVPTDISSIRSAIDRAIKHKTTLTTKGTKQLAQFNWETIARQTMRVYESVANKSTNR